MTLFTPVSSVKFEIYIPTTWVDSDDPTQTPQPVPMAEVYGYLDAVTAKYEQAYTVSNPYGPPPFAGVYQGTAPERNYWVIIIIPEQFLNEADQDIQEMIAAFEERYQQEEIFTHRYPVYRYMPNL